MGLKGNSQCCFGTAAAASSPLLAGSSPLLPAPICFHAVGVGAVAYLMKSDVRKGTTMLRQNLRHIRNFLEEQAAAAE